jgi:hypothetical protein
MSAAKSVFAALGGIAATAWPSPPVVSIPVTALSQSSTASVSPGSSGRSTPAISLARARSA